MKKFGLNTFCLAIACVCSTASADIQSQIHDEQSLIVRPEATVSPLNTPSRDRLKKVHQEAVKSAESGIKMMRDRIEAIEDDQKSVEAEIANLHRVWNEPLTPIQERIIEANELTARTFAKEKLARRRALKFFEQRQQRNLELKAKLFE